MFIARSFQLALFNEYMKMFKQINYISNTLFSTFNMARYQHFDLLSFRYKYDKSCNITTS